LHGSFLECRILQTNESFDPENSVDSNLHGSDVNDPKTKPSSVSIARTVYKDALQCLSIVNKLVPSLAREYFNQK
jgi:hypothetical protein